MLDFLLFPLSFGLILAVYMYAEWRNAQKSIPHFPEIVSRNPDVEFLFSMQILNTTHTNNNCGSVNGIFSDLELEGVQSILGKSLQADMAGYMQ